MILCPLLNAELDEEEKLRLRGIMSTPSDERVEWLRKHKNRPDYKIYQPTKEEVEYTVSLIESYDPFTCLRLVQSAELTSQTFDIHVSMLYLTLNSK